MSNVYKVINEQIVVEISDSYVGCQQFFVLNGAWRGTLDYAAGEYWADMYPTDKTAIHTIRPAVKGEFAPYY